MVEDDSTVSHRWRRLCNMQVFMAVTAMVGAKRSGAPCLGACCQEGRRYLACR